MASCAMLHLVAPSMVPVCIELDLSRMSMTRPGAHSAAPARSSVAAARAVEERRTRERRRTMGGHEAPVVPSARRPEKREKATLPPPAAVWRPGHGARRHGYRSSRLIGSGPVRVRRDAGRQRVARAAAARHALLLRAQAVELVAVADDLEAAQPVRDLVLQAL